MSAGSRPVSAMGVSRMTALSTFGGGLKAAALTVKSFSARARAWTETDR